MQIENKYFTKSQKHSNKIRSLVNYLSKCIQIRTLNTI